MAVGPAELYVGLMSGTSLDGVDAVLADCASGRPQLLAHHHQSFPDALRNELLALNTSGHDEIHRSRVAANALVECYAAAVSELLRDGATDARRIRAIGVHGQTVRHRPDLSYTVQLNDPARLAELTGIDVVADFRSRDVAAGGQGAPLVPAFHQVVFASNAARAVINIGGISNITALDHGRVLGFDAGPGNVLLDAWTARHFAEPFDRDGARAAQFAVDDSLVNAWLGDPYFAAPPPKSTGRDLFTLDWALRVAPTSTASPGVVLASLTELTVRALAHAIDRWCPEAREIVVCGGGARNSALMKGLQQRSGGRPVLRSDALGVAAEHVEALAFAWLASRHCHRLSGNVPTVTGAQGLRILGALYPAQ